MHRFSRAVAIAVFAGMAIAGSFACPAFAADAPKAITEKIAGMDHKDGFFPFDYDQKNGKIYLEVTRLDQDFLLLDQLPHGLGSNDVGLDRGQLGREKLVRFSRAGNKVLLVEPNLKYRSSSSNPDERQVIHQSFAESILWGFPIEAEEPGRILVDATAFFLRDAHGVSESLERAKQGSYKLDQSRCALAIENTRNFPNNTEVEAVLTFASEGAPHGA